MLIPTHVNNIIGISIRNISSTGSLNLGNDIHKGYMANSVSSGGQTDIGDNKNSFINNFQLNISSSPNLSDQSQIQF
jgi:hypothetical protein